MTNETENPGRNSDPQGRNEAVVMCACYPSHCEHGDTCWCEPTVELLDSGDKLIIHRKGH